MVSCWSVQVLPIQLDEMKSVDGGGSGGHRDEKEMDRSSTRRRTDHPG